MCYTGKTEEAQKHRERAIQETVEKEHICKNQCGANDTQPTHTTIKPRRRSSNPTHCHVMIIAQSCMANHTLTQTDRHTKI